MCPASNHRADAWGGKKGERINIDRDPLEASAWGSKKEKSNNWIAKTRYEGDSEGGFKNTKPRRVRKREAGEVGSTGIHSNGEKVVGVGKTKRKGRPHQKIKEKGGYKKKKAANELNVYRQAGSVLIKKRGKGPKNSQNPHTTRGQLRGREAYSPVQWKGEARKRKYNTCDYNSRA